MKLVKLYNFIKSSYNNSKVNNDELLSALKGLNLLEKEDLTTKDIFNVFRSLDEYNNFFSTQQITHANYNNFKEHVFFSSAVSKIDNSFYRILKCPYDKDEITNITYKNKNDGYTKFLLENEFPKCRGSIIFNGNNIIDIVDKQGYLFNDYEENSLVKSGILNPKNNNFCFDFWLKITDYGNNNQVIFSKYTKEIGLKENGYICFISNIENNNNDVYLNIIISMKDNLFLKKYKIKKDTIFKHVCLNIFSVNAEKNIELFINSQKIKEDVNVISEGTLVVSGFDSYFSNPDVSLTIGGNLQRNLVVNETNFSNLKGEVDEFKILFKRKTKNQIKQTMHKNVYANNFLKLYLRFNEPIGQHINNFVCIDYSGNKLHGVIRNYSEESLNYIVSQDTSQIRNNNVDTLPMKKERDNENPVLIGSFQEIIDKRQLLVDKALVFDKENPNNIFKILPKHYFIESSNRENLPIFSRDDAYVTPKDLLDESGEINKNSGSKLSNEFEVNSDLVNIVLIWARFFDELKLYISSIDKVLNISYDSLNKDDISSIFLPLACKTYGIEFSEIFPSITKEKLSGENLLYEDIVSDLSIRKLQNLLWQRFLINSQDYLKSKGTIKSIESAFNSFGIDYSKFIDINEYSSYNDLTKGNNYKKENLNTNIISFSSLSTEFENIPTFENNLLNSFSSNKLFLEIENIRRKSISNQSLKDNAQILNGLGNEWTIEVFFNYSSAIKNKSLFLNNNTGRFSLIQNLFRLDLENNVVLTIHHERQNIENYFGDIHVNVYPVKNNSNYVISQKIENINIYDNPKYLSISQDIIINEIDSDNDEIVYNINIGDIGEVNPLKQKENFVIRKTIANINDKVLQNNISTNNENLSFKIGSYNYPDIGSEYLSATSDFVQNNTIFEGEILKIRSWDKILSNKEIESHIKDIENVGESQNSPFKKIIFDFDSKFKNDKIVQNNVLTLAINDNSFNFTEENQRLNTCLIKTLNLNYENTNIVKPFTLIVKKQNIKYDQPVKTNRVDIHSFLDDDNKAIFNNFNNFPSNVPYRYYNYDDISRVSIDMSTVRILNDDISKMIHDISLFNSKVNNFYSKYDYSYKNLDVIRKSYFDKFSDKDYIYYSDIGNVFKFFDNIMQKTLSEAIPYNTRYLGFNLVYESHVLERHKYVYKNKDSNLSVVDDLNFVNYSQEPALIRRGTSYNSNRQQVYQDGRSTLRGTD
jgi:hypothetical protein